MGDAGILDNTRVPTTDVTVGDDGDGALPVEGRGQKLGDVAVGDVAEAVLRYGAIEEVGQVVAAVLRGRLVVVRRVGVGEVGRARRHHQLLERRAARRVRLVQQQAAHVPQERREEREAGEVREHPLHCDRWRSRFVPDSRRLRQVGRGEDDEQQGDGDAGGGRRHFFFFLLRWWRRASSSVWCGTTEATVQPPFR
jgi:hypothetical protein